MDRCSAAELHFRINPAGFNALLEFLTGFILMNTQEIVEMIKKAESPLKRQLLMVGLLTRLLEEKGKSPPIIIGGCALSYYSREVFFTADIDLAYADREALDAVLKNIGFEKRGRYWVNEALNIAIEAPASVLVGEDSPVEVVDLGGCNAGLSG